MTTRSKLLWTTIAHVGNTDKCVKTFQFLFGKLLCRKVLFLRSFVTIINVLLWGGDDWVYVTNRSILQSNFAVERRIPRKQTDIFQLSLKLNISFIYMNVSLHVLRMFLLIHEVSLCLLRYIVRLKVMDRNNRKQLIHLIESVHQ